uniref:ribosomal protein S3 n=1 Tax=Bangia atropurpurea TaxID=31347 RepID=UPI001FCCC8AC|nr:ribosomal protein S3 [Bangia atropurpurea]UNJ18835.1 ribosomal protein S3 [Bangia atropurpurea]
MGQKIKPKGFRIGLNDLWLNEGQCYGKKFKNPKRLVKETGNTSEFFKQYLESKTLVKGQINQKNFKDSLCYNVHYTPTLPNINPYINNITIKVSRIFCKTIYIRSYNTTLWYQNGTLLCEFIKNSLKKGIVFRKIVITIKRLLALTPPHTIVIKTLSGTKLLKYTGLKIRYAGRFGSSRSRMANSLVYLIGAVSLQKIETHIEFHESLLYTKQGICNLQVWMAYKIIPI